MSAAPPPNVEEIGSKVLDFYRVLPFNVYSTAGKAAENIAAGNQVEAWYGDLHRILSSGKAASYVDAGCGGGWLAVTVSYYYKVDTWGIDFNPKAIEVARSVSEECRAPVTFKVGDLFKAAEVAGRTFDIVSSIGVLHHTADPRGGVESISAMLAPGAHARLYIGLYHSYGRLPFLGHFENMRAAGRSEEEMFSAFCEMHSNLQDPQHLRSWFRDQVLHPHESQHTLEEVCGWLDKLGFAVESSSVNQFKPFKNVEELFAMERDYEAISQQRIAEKRYFPGFFTVCARRK